MFKSCCVHASFSFSVDCCDYYICCADVEEMSDSFLSLLTANLSDSDAEGDAYSQQTSDIMLSVTEYTSLTSRLAAAEEAVKHTAEQLQHALVDLEKMRLFLLFSYTDC